MNNNAPHGIVVLGVVVAAAVLAVVILQSLGNTTIRDDYDLPRSGAQEIHEETTHSLKKERALATYHSGRGVTIHSTACADSRKLSAQTVASQSA